MKILIGAIGVLFILAGAIMWLAVDHMDRVTQARIDAWKTCYALHGDRAQVFRVKDTDHFVCRKK